MLYVCMCVCYMHNLLVFACLYVDLCIFVLCIDTEYHCSSCLISCITTAESMSCDLLILFYFCYLQSNRTGVTAP